MSDGAAWSDPLAGFDSFRGVADDLGEPDGVAEIVDLFRRDPLARLRMSVARRAGVPYGEVLRRWDESDLLAEAAWDALQGMEHAARCPSCGVDPADVVDEHGRPGDDSRWKLELVSCVVCAELERAQRDLESAKMGHGTRWRVAPRRPGDPWRDDGGSISDALEALD